KWEIPAGRQIPARGFISFDENTGFNNPPGAGFGLNKAGEDLYLSYFPLSGGPGAVVDAVSYEGQENDWSLGRVPDGGAYWDHVTPRTRESPNAGVPPRVVISEILYHDGGIPTNHLPAAQLEFVEIHNATSQPAPLFNNDGSWRLAGGIDFNIPLG